jgi:chromosome segregation ATPase
MTRFPCKFLCVLLLVSLAGCKSTADLIYEPAPDDPLDGQKGSLSKAGTNIEMDWGPKQSHLLDEFTKLKEKERKQDDAVNELRAEKQNLERQLHDETAALQKEKALRAQAEAETESLRERRRELEARILGLSIEKAKLEQATLLSKIEALRAALEPATGNATEAAAPAPRSR